MNHVKVTDAPFLAKGDGITNDREAIQNAIDYVYSLGGGTVELTENKTFNTGGIIIRSNITLLFGEGSTLLQSLKKCFRFQHGLLLRRFQFG